MKTSKISPIGFLLIIISQTVAKNLPWIIHFDEETGHLKGGSQIDFAMGNVFLFFNGSIRYSPSCLETFQSKIDNQVPVDDDDSATMLKNWD